MITSKVTTPCGIAISLGDHEIAIAARSFFGAVNIQNAAVNSRNVYVLYVYPTLDKFKHQMKSFVGVGTNFSIFHELKFGAEKC